MDRVAPEAFGFLVTECGYTTTLSNPTHVRFESPTMFVDVFVDPRSYEVIVEFGRRADESLTYHFEELATVVPDMQRVRSRGTVRSPADVAAFLTRVAADAKKVLCSLAYLPETTFEVMNAKRREVTAKRQADAAKPKQLPTTQKKRTPNK